ncbi:cystatin domain-containing protein [Vibrio alfacsensis]|uniref:cystatin domain-containing protein n=1 Tax=Vibrio alfacsensis TaxID=1074311 RepID=UPI00406848E5
MKLRMFWTLVFSISALPLASSALAVDKQMSQEMKQKMRAICSPEKGLAGGWKVSEVTPDARRSLNMVLHQMNATDKLKQINQVRTQVVAGIRYAIEFELKNGEIWNAMVFHSSRGDYMIERHAKKGALCPNSKP